VCDVRDGCGRTGFHPPLHRARWRSSGRSPSRVVSICSGTFALVSSGLLDGRRAAINWLFADRLSERFPNVQVDPAALYLEDDNVITSAGGAAGLDLCVHLVRQDFGAAIANLLARAYSSLRPGKPTGPRSSRKQCTGMAIWPAT
jgi:transcriptional regulator GlxA family with amidase domain